MADEKAADQSSQQDVKAADKSQDVKTDSIPYERFKEVNEAKKELENKLREREEAEKKASDNKLLEEKKYQELLKQRDSELDSLKKEREELAKFRQEAEEKEKSRRETLLKAIEDKELRSIAEKLPTSDDISAFAEKIKGKSDSRTDPKGAAAEKKEAFQPKKGETAYEYGKRVASMVSGGK